MNASNFNQTVLSSESRVNLITIAGNSFSVASLNRDNRSINRPMRGNKEITYKTLKGALNCKVAKQNGGVSVLVDLHNQTDYAKAIITRL